MSKYLFQKGKNHPNWTGGPAKLNCVICSKEFYRRKAILKDEKRGKYCTRKCYDVAQKKKVMELSAKWKGGKSHDVHGYILVKNPNHPNAKANGYVMEHRMVMEKHIGRYLDREENVHHINFDKTDNRIENLMLFENASEHTKYHKIIEKI